MGTTTITANGTAPAATFPLDSFKDAAQHLRRPFTVEAVKFKPQSTTRSGKTLCVAYIDARLAVERLNMIVPHLWHDEYEPLGAKHLICRLTVDGITRQDIGEGTGKALYSDALKRAAVKFGIGVSLYAIPAMFLDGKVEYLNEGSKELRDLKARYRRWLESTGIRSFGDPLDHGDAEDGQGDPEAEAPPNVNTATGEVTAPVTATPAQTLPSADVDRIAETIRGLIDREALTTAQVKTHLVAAGATDTTSVKSALATLSAAEAAELEAHFNFPVPA